MTPAQEIVAERQRQKSKGYADSSITHPLTVEGEIMMAAMAHMGSAMLHVSAHEDEEEREDAEEANLEMYPWHPDTFQPGDMRTALIKAGALIIAQLELMERLDTEARHQAHEEGHFEQQQQRHPKA